MQASCEGLSTWILDILSFLLCLNSFDGRTHSMQVALDKEHLDFLEAAVKLLAVMWGYSYREQS